MATHSGQGGNGAKVALTTIKTYHGTTAAFGPFMYRPEQPNKGLGFKSEVFEIIDTAFVRQLETATVTAVVATHYIILLSLVVL